MKFGESFLFPDPDSRVSHEPLKLTETKPLECFAEHELLTLPKTRHLWDREGESLLDVKLSIRAGAFGVGLKAACSGAQLGKI